MAASASATPSRARAAPVARVKPQPDTTSGTALYQQIKDFVAGSIQDGSWKAGDRLPSENDLVQQFGVSRMTVNRALRELLEQGLSLIHISEPTRPY